MDDRERLALAHAESGRLRRQVIALAEDLEKLKKLSAAQEVLKLQAELASVRAERDVYRKCCWRAFQRWQLDHPRVEAWPDGAQQICDVLAKQEAEIVGLKARLGE